MKGNVKKSLLIKVEWLRVKVHVHFVEDVVGFRNVTLRKKYPKIPEMKKGGAYDRGFILGGTPGIDRYIQALQQTEWDVEVEMEYYHNGNFVEDGKTHPVTIAWRPKVDEDGFIILKRI